MPVYKNEDNGTWYVLTRYVDWKGERKQKCKRGFETKREAQEWERVFKQQSAADMDMNFSAFVELYMETRLNEVKQVRKKIPPCKLVMLCDENSAPDIAREVANAKKDGLIDAFFYSSVTEKYLTAALASL